MRSLNSLLALAILLGLAAPARAGQDAVLSPPRGGTGATGLGPTLQVQGGRLDVAPATPSQRGAVKPDGTSIGVAGDGTLSLQPGAAAANLSLGSGVADGLKQPLNLNGGLGLLSSAMTNGDWIGWSGGFYDTGIPWFLPLKPSNNLSEITNAATARYNLGIGSPVQYAEPQPGLDWCAKVAFAASLLPPTGGVVDAGGLAGAQTCVGGLNIAADNVTVRFGGAVLSVSAQIQFNGQSDALVCPESGGYLSNASGPTVIQQAPGANLPVLIYFAKGRPNVTGCIIDGNKAANSAGVAVVQAKSSQGVLRDTMIENGPGDNFQCLSTGAANQCQQWSILQSQFIAAAKRNLFCFGGADSMVTASFFENAGGAGVELDNCPTWRVLGGDFGGNGRYGYAGLQAVNAGGVAPSLYVHGAAPTANLYLGANLNMIGFAQFGNYYGQPILVDGSTVTNVATLGGSVTAGDVVTVTFTSAYLNGGAPISIAYTAQAGDSLTSVAAALAAAINANATLTGFELGATAAAGVLTIYNPSVPIPVASPGAPPTGTVVALSNSLSAGATETVSWATSNAGSAAVASHIVGDEIIGSPNIPANGFYPIELYNVQGGGDNIADITIRSTLATTPAGLVLIHGLSGYDSVSNIMASGTFGSTSWSQLVNVPATTQVSHVCAVGMAGCFNTSAFFTSSQAGTNAVVAQTQGASAGDSTALKAANPSTASFGVVKQTFALAGADAGYLSYTREGSGSAARMLLDGFNNSGTLTHLLFAEAYKATVSGCSVNSTNQTISQPAFTVPLSAACSNQNITVTFQVAANDGWVCAPAVNLTTGVSYNQTTGGSTTTAVFKGVSGSNGDVLQFGPCSPN